MVQQRWFLWVAMGVLVLAVSLTVARVSMPTASISPSSRVATQVAATEAAQPTSGPCFGDFLYPEVDTSGPDKVVGIGSETPVHGYCHMQYQLQPTDLTAGWTVTYPNGGGVIAITYVITDGQTSSTLLLLEAGSAFNVQEYDGISSVGSVAAVPFVIDVYYPLTASATLDETEIAHDVSNPPTNGITVGATSADFGVTVYPDIAHASFELLGLAKG
jgi:hypothetical protein